MRPIAKLFHRAPYHKRGNNAGGKTVRLTAEECRAYVAGLKECQELYEALLACKAFLECLPAPSPNAGALLRRVARALTVHE